MRPALVLLAISAVLVSVPAMAAAEDGAPPAPDCADGQCRLRMTADQLLKTAERLVLARRFDEAKPLIAALHQAPELAMETAFLEGYVAVETGDLETGVKRFRAVLADHPGMTRARLELARALMLQGKDKAADHHFRLAEESGDLPPAVARTIYAARGLIRDRRVWTVTLDLGLAPDTNINNATSDRTVDVIFGNTSLPMTLDDTARSRSGLGQTAALTTSARLRLSDSLAVTADANGQAINYRGKDADDISALIAVGPELTLKDGARIGVTALGARRWFGGKLATSGLGGRMSFQKELSGGRRIGLQVEVRDQNSGYGAAYGGTTYNAYASYERVVRRSMIASAVLFARRESLQAEAYSSTEVGGNLGLGGELPWGVNAGLSAGLSRALYDAPIPYFSPDPRHDWRVNGRVYLGLRKVRVAGFSPSVTYSYSESFSNLGFYDTRRHRLQFGLSRFF